MEWNDLMNLTPEQIGEINDWAENFYGKTVDFAKVQRYRQIRDDLNTFWKLCPDVRRVKELPPNHRERHALIYLDFPSMAAIDPPSAKVLSRILKKADQVFISARNDQIRISVSVENIWKD